jgi:hypothetical protein
MFKWYHAIIERAWHFACLIRTPAKGYNNMKSHILRSLLAAFAATSVALANGGGYIRGGVANTGDIEGFEPTATENVQILDEKLHIRAGKSKASVEVRYLMRNVTDKKTKVRFGFPAEESFGNPNPYNAAQVEPHENPAYCKNYQITAAGKPLKVKWQAEKNPENDERMKHLSGWNISEITFAAGEEIPVMIRFDSEYPHESWFVSDDSSDSASIFRYRLSTAACWHGPIVQGRVVVEPDGIHPEDIRVIKPVNRFKKDGDRWIWNFENLEPTLNDDLEIECQPATRFYGSQLIGKYRENLPSHLYVDFIERGKSWSMLHANYTVEASSTLSPDGKTRYDPENVRDRWGENAWSEGAEGSGTGEWLEITPAEPKPLQAIHIKPGYQKSKTNLFKANARPKTMRIELNGEHRFDAEIPDREEEIEVPVIGYEKPVKKIRLTFTAVYPGNRYEDLCITRVLLHAKLDRKPEIQPAR